MITLSQTAMPKMRIGRRSFPFEYYILKIVGPAAERLGGRTVVGKLADRPIFATVIDSSGDRYRYVGLAQRLSDGQYDVESLSLGEWIVDPGLIYISEDVLVHSTIAMRERAVIQSRSSLASTLALTPGIATS